VEEDGGSGGDCGPQVERAVVRGITGGGGGLLFSDHSRPATVHCGHASVAEGSSAIATGKAAATTNASSAAVARAGFVHGSVSA
jgi:hypothetical protein